MRNNSPKNQKGFTQHHFYSGKSGLNLKRVKSGAGSPSTSSGAGFTLIELIIYLAIVAMILTSISYLILDILGGQTKNYAGQEINFNLRFISNNLTKDIRSAQDISSLTADTLILTMPGDDITYNFDSGNNILTRQLGAATPADVNSNEVEVTGSFTDLSYLNRTKNVGISLIINYKNPDNLPDYNSSTTAEFAVELRGRR